MQVATWLEALMSACLSTRIDFLNTELMKRAVKSSSSDQFVVNVCKCVCVSGSVMPSIMSLSCPCVRQWDAWTYYEEVLDSPAECRQLNMTQPMCSVFCSLRHRDVWNLCFVHAGSVSQQDFPQSLHHRYGKDTRHSQCCTWSHAHMNAVSGGK